MVPNLCGTTTSIVCTTVVLNHYYLEHDGTTRHDSRSHRAAVRSEARRLPFGVLLARLGQEAMARFRKALRPLDLSAQQYVVLKQLQTFGAASQATLAEALGIDYSNLATVTAELSDRGLIERYRHESDRRRYVVELSERGTELVAEADAAVAEGEEGMVRTLAEEERERFWLMLREVADAAQLCPRTPVERCRGLRRRGSARTCFRPSALADRHMRRGSAADAPADLGGIDGCEEARGEEERREEVRGKKPAAKKRAAKKSAASERRQPGRSATATRSEGVRQVLVAVAGVGLVWIAVSVVILQFDQASITTVGIIVGTMFLGVAVQNFVLAGHGRARKWLFAIFGVLFLGAAVLAFISPENTFAALADILGFLFLMVGIFWIIEAFAAARSTSSGGSG